MGVIDELALLLWNNQYNYILSYGKRPRRGMSRSREQKGPLISSPSEARADMSCRGILEMSWTFDAGKFIYCMENWKNVPTIFRGPYHIDTTHPHFPSINGGG